MSVSMGKKLYSTPPLPDTFFPRNQPAPDRIISPRRSMNLETETHCYPFHTLVGHLCVVTNCTKPHVALWWGSQSHVGVFRDLFIDTSIGCRISQGKEVRYHTGNKPVVSVLSTLYLVQQQLLNNSAMWPLSRVPSALSSVLASSNFGLSPCALLRPRPTVLGGQ